jgi:hypothetical protein
MTSIFFISLLLLSCVHRGEFLRMATANLYRDNTNTFAGVITVTQENSFSLVRVTGTVLGLGTANATHVYSMKDFKKNYHQSIFYSRVFMFIQKV